MLDGHQPDEWMTEQHFKSLSRRIDFINDQLARLRVLQHRQHMELLLEVRKCQNQQQR